MLIALCLLCLAIEARARGHARYGHTHRAARRVAMRYPLGRLRGPVTVAFAARSRRRRARRAARDDRLLAHATGAAAVTPADVSPELLWQATLASSGYGLMAAAVTTLLALPLAFLLVRYPGRVATLLERATMTVQGVPGIVVALAIVSITVRLLQPLYQSAPALVAVRDPVPAAGGRQRARRAVARAGPARGNRPLA